MKFTQLSAVGRIGQDAKIVNHNSRDFVAFQLGVDDGYKNRDGVWVDRVIWYDCTSEQERFLKLASHFKRGQQLMVQGKPGVRLWQDKEGHPQATINIRLDSIVFGEKPKPKPIQEAAPAPARNAAPATTTAASPFESSDESNDLPF